MALNFKKIWNGLKLVSKITSTSDSLGDFEVLSSNNKAHYHNGTSNSPIVTEAHAATLTNKSIDADNNPISNIEVDNLKTGVLNTSTTLAGATDLQVPSALAVKTYVDASSGDVQADVDDLITLTGVPAGSTDLGTFTGTTIPDASTVKQALQALETAGETTASGLAAHLADATDAHDASAISLVPFGDVVATDVQAGFVELKSDIDAKLSGAGTSTDNAVVRFDGTTGAAIQNSLVTISDLGTMQGLTGITSTGQATFTNTLTQGVIREAITDDNTATGSNQSLNILGTSIIRLTNSGLTSISSINSQDVAAVYTIINQTGNSVTINNNAGGTIGILTGTKAALTLADEASIIVKYDNTEARWMVIGGTGAGGSASLATIAQLTGTDVSSWSTGNNASFLGGGTLSGTFVANTSTPLQGVASYQYTQAAGSLNDYFSSAVQPVDARFRGRDAALVFPYTYNGNTGDIQAVVYCATSLAILSPDALIPASTTNGIYKTIVTIPSTCTGIRIGFQVKTLSSGSVFQFDSLELTSDTLSYATLQNATSFLKFQGASTKGSTATSIVRFDTLSESNGTDYRVVSDATNGTAVTFLKAGKLAVSATVNTSGATANVIYITKNQSNLTSSSPVANETISTGQSSTTSSIISCGAEVDIQPNDVIRVMSGSTLAAFTTNNFVLSFKAVNSTILTTPDTFSTDTAALTYAGSGTYTLSTLANAPIGTFITWTYASSSNTATQTNAAPPTQTTASMATDGILITARPYNAASTSGAPARVAIQIGKGLKGVSLGGYKTTGKTTAGSLDFSFTDTTTAFGLNSRDYNEVTGILVIDAGYNALTTVTGRIFSFSDITNQSSSYVTINASKNPAILGITSNTYVARATNTAGTSISNVSDTKIPLTAGGIANNLTVDTVNNRISATASGTYEASARIRFQSAAYTAGDNVAVRIYKNGVFYSELDILTVSTATLTLSVNGIDTVPMAVGDYIEFYAVNTRTGGATSLSTTAGHNHFTVKRLSGV